MGRHPKTYAAARGRQRQAKKSKVSCVARQPPLSPSDLQEDHPPLEKLSRARREQRVQAGRHGVDRGEQADLEVEALDGGPGRTEETCVSATLRCQRIRKRTRCINDSD